MTIYHVDDDYSLANWLTKAKAGDEVILHGSFGAIEINGGKWNKIRVGSIILPDQCPPLTGPVTIRGVVSRDDSVQSINVVDSDYWQFRDLSVYPGHQPETTTAVKLKGDHLAFVNNYLTHGDSTGWTSQDWLTKAGHGISIQGLNGLVKDNVIETVATGIQVQDFSDGTEVKNNTVKYICRDGIRSLSDNVVVKKNYLTRFRVGDKANHYDGFQVWKGSHRFNGTVSGLTLIKNVVHCPPEPSEPLYKAPMGLTVTHTYLKDSVVSQNEFLTDRLSGINVPLKAINCVFHKNIALDINPNGGDKHTTIRINGDKSTLITGNIANYYQTKGEAYFGAGNITLGFDQYDEYFPGWRQGDFTKATAPTNPVPEPVRQQPDVQTLNDLAPDMLILIEEVLNSNLLVGTSYQDTSLVLLDKAYGINSSS